MNREKKQLVVVGGLVFLVLSVGAFQFTRKDEVPVATTKKKEVAPKVEDPAMAPQKYPELFPLRAKDPFETASFVAGSKASEVKPPATMVAHPLNDSGQKAVNKIHPTDFNPDPNWMPKPGGVISPVPPPKPVFGYTLIGITEGAHPIAVFDDGKGNQQLVEAGQGIGPSATIISITRGTVRVKFNAETLTFNVGGNPNAK